MKGLYFLLLLLLTSFSYGQPYGFRMFEISGSDYKYPDKHFAVINLKKQSIEEYELYQLDIDESGDKPFIQIYRYEGDRKIVSIEGYVYDINDRAILKDAVSGYSAIVRYHDEVGFSLDNGYTTYYFLHNLDD